MYFRNALAALVVFDLATDIDGENLRFWVDMLGVYAPKDITILIVGNKIDLVNA